MPGLISRSGRSPGEGGGNLITQTEEMSRREDTDRLQSMGLQRVGHD